MAFYKRLDTINRKYLSIHIYLFDDILMNKIHLAQKFLFIFFDPVKVDIIKQIELVRKQQDDLISRAHRLILRLFEQFDQVTSMIDPGSGRRIKIRSKLSKVEDFLVLRQVEL